MEIFSHLDNVLSHSQLLKQPKLAMSILNDCRRFLSIIICRPAVLEVRRNHKVYFHFYTPLPYLS